MKSDFLSKLLTRSIVAVKQIPHHFVRGWADMLDLLVLLVKWYLLSFVLLIILSIVVSLPIKVISVLLDLNIRDVVETAKDWLFVFYPLVILPIALSIVRKRKNE